MKSILKVLPLSGYRVEVTYLTGEVIISEFAHLIKPGTVFEPLADEDFFKKVSIGHNATYITWPGEIDCCADGLWIEANSKSII
jgi:hypothetical protein